MIATEQKFIDEDRIVSVLGSVGLSDSVKVRDILQKARKLGGISDPEIATLMNVEDEDLLEEMFAAARYVKHEIYGNRLVIFAPLYISNYCRNECTYCAFRVGNKALKRRALNAEELANEVRVLIREGHKRLLMVAGESYTDKDGFDYILKSIDTIYATKEGPGEIRRVNVNLAPLPVEQFRQLKERGIGTFQLFQETYHRQTYDQVHVSGMKRNYDWRVTAFDRAMQAGIDDVGTGLLFGLYDWKFEVLALMQHMHHLEAEFGVGPHTISVPRIEPAFGSDLATRPPHAVSDADFLKLVAILRLAVPYTGLIMSTRESAAVRRATFALGVSQISAGSRTNPGGYAELGEEGDSQQFQLGDHRPTDEVIRDVAALGYIPSFCTACYRLGRTGRDFMDLAKPGLIKGHCSPNAMSSFLEYLRDYASPETKAIGEALIEKELRSMTPVQTKLSNRLMDRVKAGERDACV